MLAELSFNSFRLNPILEEEEYRDERKTEQEQLVSCKNICVTNNSSADLKLERARSWAWAHFLCNLVMCVCVITGDTLLTTFSTNTSLQSVAMWMAWASMALGMISTIWTGCFLRTLSSRKPSSSAHSAVRLLLLLHWTLNFIAAFFVATIPLSLNDLESWKGAHWTMVATKGVYVFALVVMITELVICFALLVGPVGLRLPGLEKIACCNALCLYDGSAAMETESVDTEPCSV